MLLTPASHRHCALNFVISSVFSALWRVCLFEGCGNVFGLLDGLRLWHQDVTDSDEPLASGNCSSSFSKVHDFGKVHEMPSKFGKVCTVRGDSTDNNSNAATLSPFFLPVKAL